MDRLAEIRAICWKLENAATSRLLQVIVIMIQSSLNRLASLLVLPLRAHLKPPTVTHDMCLTLRLGNATIQNPHSGALLASPFFGGRSSKA